LHRIPFQYETLQSTSNGVRCNTEPVMRQIVQVRLDDGVREALQHKATQMGVPLSTYIRVKLREMVLGPDTNAPQRNTNHYNLVPPNQNLNAPLTHPSKQKPNEPAKSWEDDYAGLLNQKDTPPANRSSLLEEWEEEQRLKAQAKLT
jgi:hypothetical protein